MPSTKTSWFSLRNALFALVVLVMLSLAAYKFFSPPPKPSYLTAPVALSDLEDAVLATGTIQAYKQVSVGAQVSGQIKSLKVALGDRVKQGQLIAEIDSLTQQNTLRNAAAALQSSQAQLAAKQATLKQAELAFHRAEQLLSEEAGTRENFEAAEATRNTTRAEIAALNAQITQSKISVDTANLNLGYTKIVAPIDGTVVALITQEGQTVNANQSTPTIIKLARMDPVTIKAQISEADVTRVRPGQKVYFTILGEPEKRYTTTLRAIEPAPDSISTDSTTSTTSTASTTSSAIYYNGLLDVPNADDKLRISMTAQVHIVLAEAPKTLSIPSVALGEKDRNDRYAVRILDKQGNATPRQVKIGLNNNVSAQVLDGLREGDQVILGEATANTPTSTKRMGPPPM